MKKRCLTFFNNFPDPFFLSAYSEIEHQRIRPILP
jgi:hypothetical protein